VKNYQKTSMRTHYCGELGLEQNGQTLTLCGWVHHRRDHGGLVFVDLRDRSGLVQVVLDPQKKGLEFSKDLRSEMVIQLTGIVRQRPEGMANDKMSTGQIEVHAETGQLLSHADTPPFQITSDQVSEVLRLKYRYLDFRTRKLTQYLETRHKLMQTVRGFLKDRGFWEVETPILYKSTPEGARDYLVPSRVNPGKFYALPQSPQTLKQLLMIGGLDRYFQIARCFRDEDLRADRQPEFTQIDLEMSFVKRNDVMAVTEELLRHIWKTLKGVEIGPVPHLTYKEAMENYGSDKPDLRFDLKIQDLKEVASTLGLKIFDDALGTGGVVRGLALEQGGDLSRSFMDKYTQIAKTYGARGLVWIKKSDQGLQSPLLKALGEEKLGVLFEAVGVKEKGLALIVAGDFDSSLTALGALRLELGRQFELIDTSEDKFAWITEFPLLEYSAEDKRWVARHHPFTSPMESQVHELGSTDAGVLKNLKAEAYDLVCNGYELAGGSVRIHSSEVQSRMFKTLGISEEEAQHKFGFFLEALKYGTPPHGGVAWGFDRLTMIVCGTDAIRDVIAFPKTAKATDLMADCPSEVDQAQLLDLGIRLITDHT
jgi:aspartyl-tRNA synthetase